MKKILIVNKHKLDTLGGSEIQCDIIARELQEKGYNVLYFAVNGKRKEYNTSYKVTPRVLSNEAISEVCEQFSPDIVYWRYNKNHLLKSVKTIKKYDIPVVFSVSHISDVKRWHVRERIRINSIKNIKSAIFTLRQSVINFYNHRAFKYVDGLVSLNSDYLNIAPVANQIFIPNSSMEIKAIPFSWPRKFCIWVANIKSRKNPEKFVELARKLKHIEIDFLMIGEMQSDRYIWICDSKQTPKNFHYLGPKLLEEVNGILKESLFLVHTCEPEGFSNNFIQAWLQGKPTISLYFDPCGYISGKNLGYISGTIEQLVEDVMKLVKDEDLRNKMGQKAEKFAQENFSPQKNVFLLESFLNKLYLE